jgi:dipeptidase E
MPGSTIADAESWAVDIAGPAYTIDDQTLLRVLPHP